ncbi:MAG: dipeptidase PepE [Candidatus Marinimicrobia bacterium]|nr:dipeptidase PepE [Candidatus Neomarinimicrobiota bacterium]MCF7828459.1 dipeptidase PepE [Candidatus Neomarinimicrobiota bacterium]MCF7880947.1 dipeptidase PepE [Candidatus Neomarinimicrobiota bacterium]
MDAANRRLLLLSNSTNFGQEWLDHAEEGIREFLGRTVDEVLFVPYAAVTFSYDEYTSLAREKFGKLGYQVRSIHEAERPKEAVRNAEAIAVGGGNTFHLVTHLYRIGIIDEVRRRVLRNGIPYIGWSAGANVACPSLKTTNDMPIVEPPSFHTFNLVPFQINPHYLDEHPKEHQGETRERRIEEFIEANPDIYVVGLREGSMLRVEGDSISLIGEKPARVFRKGEEPAEYHISDLMEFLLRREGDGE